MATNGTTPTETIIGVVDSVNATGFHLTGAADLAGNELPALWLNISKFRPVEPPDRGDRVRVVHKNRYVQSVDLIASAAGRALLKPSASGGEPVRLPPPGERPGVGFGGRDLREIGYDEDPDDAAADAPTVPLPPSKDLLIIRQVAVKAAADLWSGQPGADAEFTRLRRVLETAAALETWILRSA